MSEETTEQFSGVDAVIDRMKRFPHEFFEAGPDRSRWAFIYKDYFKDSLTESEKGRIHEQLKIVRRMEFDAMVLKELFREERKDEAEETLTFQASQVRGRYKV
jgi:hypothetical protein